MNMQWSRYRARLRKNIAKSRMLWKRFRKALFSLRTLVSFCGILVMLVLFNIAIVPVRYDISIGMVPTHTITANRDVVDEITTESLRVAAEQAVQPTYHYSEGVTESVLQKFEQIYTQLDSVVQYSETLKDSASTTHTYTADELKYARTILTALDLHDFQLRTLLNTSRDSLSSLHSKLYTTLQNTMSGYVTEGNEADAIDKALQVIGYQIDYSLLYNVVNPLLKEVVEPNMVIDHEATAAARQVARDSVEPVVYKQGQNIVVKGEGRVQRYQYDMLSNLGLLSTDTVDVSIYIGASMMIVLILTATMVLLRLVDQQVTADYRRLMLIFVVMVFTLGASILMRLLDIYWAPVAMCAMLLAATIGLPSGVICNVALSVLISALAAGGSTGYTTEMVHLMACNICSGTLASILLYKRSNRLRVIGTGICTAACNFAIMMALGLMTSSTGNSLTQALWCAGGGLVSGLLCIAVQPLLEAAFNLPTPTKLLELSNPNHPLLRRLLLEAPGTYHHALVVANLAEASAEAVGANPLLARVGGYYHDIGKLRRPLYFKENQLGTGNRLTETDPYTAAQVVISHTRDGVVLAHNYHLPREVTAIIQEHHGNTPVMYFYTTALKEYGEENVDISDYRYDSNPPSTKEGAIVLLCDTIEAAVRSMQNPTPDAIEEFIIKLVRGKLQDGQLSRSPLTLLDIDEICHACATVLNGVFHERIEYPEPPASTSHSGNKPKAVPAQMTADAEELTKPWDGETQPEKPAREELRDIVLGSEPKAQGEPEDILQPRPLFVDPEQFVQEVMPLPVIEPPVPAASPSVEEILEQNEAEPEAEDDGEEIADEAEEEMIDDEEIVLEQDESNDPEQQEE